MVVVLPLERFCGLRRPGRPTRSACLRRSALRVRSTRVVTCEFVCEGNVGQGVIGCMTEPEKDFFIQLAWKVDLKVSVTL